MKILENMEACYGCGACCNICPTGAVNMKTNSEGFLEPVVDEEKCISCGKCAQVCPSINCQYPNEAEPDIFAFSAEEKILYNSSSGGIFTFLAEHILKAGGYVVGAAYDSEFRVNHIIIHNMEDLDKIRRSKYLQSSTGNTYKEVKTLLDRGESVLYSGCPCQIAGLLRFLGKEYDNLYTVDLVCHGIPSPGLFQEHLNNSYGGIENIEDVEFRIREGWASLFRVKSKSGDVKTLYNNNSVYMQSFLQDINLRASCFRCQYSRLPRQGDVTIGDLWAAAYLNLSFEYRKGVSVVLINNRKGTSLFEDALSRSGYGYHVQKLYGKEVEKPCNIKLLNANIFHPSTGNGSSDKRNQFFRTCADRSFENAVHASLHKFDVGLVLYMSNNYGSTATSYALYRAISDKGKSVAVLDNLIPLYSEAAKFARKYMKLCSDFMEKDDYRAANQCFDTFAIGSDQSWNPNTYELVKEPQYMMLGFADEDKRKISYAPSFGLKFEKKDIDDSARALYSYYLKRFDAISVREDYGVDICRDIFGVQAKQVLDPVFLCDKDVWYEISGKSKLKFNEEYLLAYILNPSSQKRQILLDAAKKLNKKIFVVLDFKRNVEINRRIMNMDEYVIQPEFIDWLAYFQHASYIITDSFHGACFSIIFGKKFVAIKNRQRQRFDSLAQLIRCPHLFYDDSTQLLGKADIFADIDYESVYRDLERERAESDRWLQLALEAEVKIKPGNDTAANEAITQLFRSLQSSTEALNQLRRSYAYEEKRKRKVGEQIRLGKSWLDIVLTENSIIPGKSALREIADLHDYFSMLKANPKYVIILSCCDESANRREKFLEVSGLPLRMDVAWRDSYVAVIDGGTVRIDEKSKEELNLTYEFVTGHLNYNVEYLDSELKVSCKPLKYCRIRVKSKGFSGAEGAVKSEIIVDNVDYSMNRIGLNVVVIDRETGGVVDSININTYSDPGLKINRV